MLIRDLVKRIGKLNKLRWLCRTTAGATAGVSVWANYLHAAHMGPVGKTLSMLPPLLWVVAFEVGSRVLVGKEFAWYLRGGKMTGIVLISAIGAGLSYFHQREAFLRYTSGDVWTAGTLPISIDGLMLVAATCLFVLNIMIQKHEDQLQIIRDKEEQRKSRDTEQPVAPTSFRVTKKDQVALFLASNPTADYKVVADALGISYNQAYNYVNQLRKAEARLAQQQ